MQFPRKPFDLASASVSLVQVAAQPVAVVVLSVLNLTVISFPQVITLSGSFEPHNFLSWDPSELRTYVWNE